MESVLESNQVSFISYEVRGMDTMKVLESIQGCHGKLSW